MGKAKRLGVFGTCDTVPKIVKATADITKLRTFPSLLESIEDSRVSRESLQLTDQDSLCFNIRAGPTCKNIESHPIIINQYCIEYTLKSKQRCIYHIHTSSWQPRISVSPKLVPPYCLGCISARCTERDLNWRAVASWLLTVSEGFATSALAVAVTFLIAIRALGHHHSSLQLLLVKASSNAHVGILMHELHGLLCRKGALVDLHPFLAVERARAMLYSILQAVLELLPIVELTGAFVLSISAKVKGVRTLCISAFLFLMFVLCVVKIHKFRIAQAKACGCLKLTQIWQLKIVGPCVLLQNLLVIFPGFMDCDGAVGPFRFLCETVLEVHLGKDRGVLHTDLHRCHGLMAAAKLIALQLVAGGLIITATGPHGSCQICQGKQGADHQSHQSHQSERILHVLVCTRAQSELQTAKPC